MDINIITKLLQATMDPKARKEAEEKLCELRNVLGFSVGLLHIVKSEEVKFKVRQAAVIYLKNMIMRSWPNAKYDISGKEVTFSLYEEDKAVIRENLVDAVVLTPSVIRTQLCVCVSQLVRHDFPERWPQMLDNVWVHLQSPDTTQWLGALFCLYRLVKHYQYKKSHEKTPMLEPMKELLPLLYQILIQLLPDDGQYSVQVQKQILKIFFSLTQQELPLSLITREIFTQWMEVLRIVTQSDVPEHTLEEDVEERPQLIWWKRKKWALRTLSTLFERYGSPGKVRQEYTEFSDWFLNNFSGGILAAIFTILDKFRNEFYISPRVMQQALYYINTAVSHAYTWKLIKPHIMQILEDIVFPLMSYSESDAELWNMDPYEYIKVKFDVFEDILSPVNAAQTLLHSVCNKRKEILQKIMNFLFKVILGDRTNPSQKDGALHMIGTLAVILLKNPSYKALMGKFLREVVFTELRSPHGHLRARACWVIHYFSDVKFENESDLSLAYRLTAACLLQEEKEPPVKVEAAIAIEMLLSSQGKMSRKYLEPHIRGITIELLKLLRETENDELTSVVRNIMIMYREKIAPLAVKICENLVETFIGVLDNSDYIEEKAMTAMGLMNTMKTTLDVIQGKPNVYHTLEPVILKAVHYVFTKSVVDLYEDTLSLCCTLTIRSISVDMWRMLQVLSDTLKRDGCDYFCEMMPTLHNYITVDTKVFLSSPIFIMCMYEMSKAVLEMKMSENIECYAVKLLEVILLQCKGRNIDQVIPIFVQLVLQRLGQDMETANLRVMCILVIIAALYYNPTLLLNTLDKIQLPGISCSVFFYFVQQWINTIHCFFGLHNRKMCVIGLVHLMQMPNNPAVQAHVQKIVPSLLGVLDRLKSAAYRERNGDIFRRDSKASDVTEEYNDERLLMESDDEEFEEGQLHFNKGAKVTNMVITTLDEETERKETEEVSLEEFTTPLDKGNTIRDMYKVFKDVLEDVESSNPAWYKQLTGHLSQLQNKTITEIVSLAEVGIKEATEG